MKKLPYGLSDFKKIIEGDFFYVDKTKFLSKLETVADTVVYLRPRRFGKTLFTSMMYYYYDISSVSLFDTLFKDTYIYKNPTPNKNNYYILKFDFSGMSATIENGTEIKNEFNNCLISGFNSFCTHYNLSYKADKTLSPSSLLKDFLSFFESVKLQNKLYIIIDEYDHFTNVILEKSEDVFKDILGDNGLIKSFYEVIKSFRSSVIDRVFITGVCSISLDSMTSGFNVATNITTHEWFNSMTALTHDEVKYLTDKVVTENTNKAFKDMLENYDGYRFCENGELVFNPTLVMYYLSNYNLLGHAPKNLMDTNIFASYEQIKNIIKIQKNKFYEQLLNDIFDNGKVIAELAVKMDLNSTMVDRNEIISLLYYFGYLTFGELNENLRLTFKIPNEVMRQVYGAYYLSILRDNNAITYDESLEKSISELRQTGNIEPLLMFISNSLKKMDNSIYRNFGEKNIQWFIYALLNIYKNFNVRTEYPSNDNFIDMFIQKNDYCNYNIIIELKYIKKKDYSEQILKEKENQAKSQIYEYLKDERISSDNIRKYVIIFIGSNYRMIEV